MAQLVTHPLLSHLLPNGCCRDDEWEEDEQEWDEAVTVLNPRAEGIPKRALCDECHRPLRRAAELQCATRFIVCARTQYCQRCGEGILPGSLHFECPDCGAVVCTVCGPGVSIDRDYDLFNISTGELSVQEMTRKQRHRRRRGLTLEALGGFGAVAELQVVKQTEALCQRVAQEGLDVFDRGWGDQQELLHSLFGTAPAATLRELAQKACTCVAAEPSLVEVSAPCKIFGDLHGQLRDLLQLFRVFGSPWRSPEIGFIFNGDFVDRGEHGLEVLGIIMALKVLYPDRVVLNRGNHEDNYMNKKYGFANECQARLGDKEGLATLNSFWTFFNHLPFACLVSNRVLVLHGGIGNGQWTLDDLRRIRRPIGGEEIERHRFLYNILWSDPIAEDCSRESSVFGVHPSLRRGTGALRFGWNVTQEFCVRNGLDLVVRSHQAMNYGFGFDVMHDEKLMRVFSARDYEGHCNDGAVLHIAEEFPEDQEQGAVLTVRPQVLRALSTS